MAIVEMKRVSIIGPVDRRDAVFRALQRVGSLDVEELIQPTEPTTDLISQRTSVERVLGVLEPLRKSSEQLEQDLPPSKRPEQVVERVERILARQGELAGRLAVLDRERDQLVPWDNLDPADLEELAKGGAHVALYVVSAKQAAALDLSAADWHGLFPLAKGAKLGLAVLKVDGPPDVGIEAVSLPNRSLAKVDLEVAEAQARLEADDQELRALSRHVPAVRAYRRDLENQIRLAQLKAGALTDEDLFAVSGWCPAAKARALEGTLRRSKVALIVEDPRDDEEPPILLDNPPFVRQFEPLIAMFSLPRYREIDPTPFVAIPMALFVGFCLGDLGYGLILALASVWALFKFQPHGETRRVVQWLALLGLSTVLVGGLTGNFFGLRYYDLLGLPPSGALFVLGRDPKLFFFVSLGFGAVQLSAGMLLRLVLELRSHRWQQALSTIGWLGVMPGVLVWGLTGTSWWFLGALVFVLVFASPSPNVLRRMGAGAWAAYNITGLAGDVMSYVRIFGLGLSSGILAMVVNTLAMLLAGIPVVGWPLAVLLLVAGHTFNFVLATVGAVVHSARLQFLEFFGKFFEGGARAYRPFAKLEGE